MKKLLIILSFIFCLGSCITAKRCNDKFPPQIEVKDSIVIKDTIIYKDTIIVVPGAYITDTFLIRDTLTFVDTIIKNNNTQLHLQVVKGRVVATCKADSLQIEINKLMKVITSRDRFLTTLKYVPKIVIEQHIPKWCWWLLLYAVATTVWTFRKQILTLLKITV